MYGMIRTVPFGSGRRRTGIVNFAELNLLGSRKHPAYCARAPDIIKAEMDNGG